MATFCSRHFHTGFIQISPFFSKGSIHNKSWLVQVQRQFITWVNDGQNIRCQLASLGHHETSKDGAQSKSHHYKSLRIFYNSSLPMSPVCSTVLSRYIEIFFFRIIHDRHPYLARKGMVWDVANECSLAEVLLFWLCCVHYRRFVSLT